MLKRTILIFTAFFGLTVVVLGVLVLGWHKTLLPRRPDIPFAPMQDTALKDPDNPTKVFRVDMAKVEQDCPLTRLQLASLLPEHIMSLSQEELDQLYGRLTAGPIPDGVYMGDLVFPRGGGARRSTEPQQACAVPKQTIPFTLLVGEDNRTRLGEAIGGVEGVLANEQIKMLERVGRGIWKGKIFYRDQMVLRNFTKDDLIVNGIIKVDDLNAVTKMEVPNEDWWPPFARTTKVNLLFPAKLHCGQSLLDSRRESIIIDYAFNDEVPGYQRNPDALVGRNGLRVRDEVRMIRPGFYLGRAYANRILVVNFTLYNEKVADAGRAGFIKGDKITEDCWAGEQLRHAAAN